MQDLQNKGKDGGDDGSGRNTSENLGQTASAEAAASKIEKDKQYGGAEVIEIINNALAADGREQKDRADTATTALNSLRGEHEGLKNQFNTVSEQVAQFLKTQDEVEIAGIKDNQPLADVVLGRQANRKEALRLQGVEASQKTKDTQQNERENTLNQRDIDTGIKLAAMAAGVDPEALKARVPDGDPARLTLVAKDLKGSGQTTTTTTTPDPKTLDEQGRVKFGADGKEIPVALRTKPASAQSSGGDQRSLSARLLEKAKAK